MLDRSAAASGYCLNREPSKVSVLTTGGGEEVKQEGRSRKGLPFPAGH